MSLVTVVILTAAAFSFVAWVASLLTADYSWVDRLWSVVPVVYVAEIAGYAHFSNARLDLMAIVVLVWGARLTFNLARKGGYTGLEDYRWAVLRERMNAWQFQVFNFFFIVIYQNVILVLITLPALTAYQHRHSAFTALDAILAAVFLACTLGETVADNQQWQFQSWKVREREEGRTPEPQFLQSGLFRFSRHPNYFFEVAQWWMLFFMGASATASLIQWTIVGAVLLTLLFVGSTRFTEEITLSRYPEYAEYQRRTSAVVPWSTREQRPAR